jgi:hypothetical protein
MHAVSNAESARKDPFAAKYAREKGSTSIDVPAATKALLVACKAPLVGELGFEPTLGQTVAYLASRYLDSHPQPR